MKTASLDNGRLTDCEQLVMKVIWRSEEELCLMEIMERVNKHYNKEWKPQTVSTFISRLVKKNFISMRRTGRQFYYKIQINEKDYSDKVIEECVDFWSDGDVSKLIASLHNVRMLSQQEKENILKFLVAIEEQSI